MAPAQNSGSAWRWFWRVQQVYLMQQAQASSRPGGKLLAPRASHIQYSSSPDKRLWGKMLLAPNWGGRQVSRRHYIHLWAVTSEQWRSLFPFDSFRSDCTGMCVFWERLWGKGVDWQERTLSQNNGTRAVGAMLNRNLFWNNFLFQNKTSSIILKSEVKELCARNLFRIEIK